FEVSSSAPRDLAAALARVCDEEGMGASLDVERLAEEPWRWKSELRRRFGGGGSQEPAMRLLLVVDHVERMFVDEARQQVGMRMLDALRDLVDDDGPVRLHALCVMRSVHWDRLKQTKALKGKQFWLKPLSEANLRDAVTMPARNAGGAIEPFVVNALIDDLCKCEEQPLPFLQLAMQRMWEGRDVHRPISGGLFEQWRSGQILRRHRIHRVPSKPSDESEWLEALAYLLVDVVYSERASSPWVSRRKATFQEVTGFPYQSGLEIALRRLMEARLAMSAREAIGPVWMLTHDRLLEKDIWPELAEVTKRRLQHLVRLAKARRWFEQRFRQFAGRFMLGTCIFVIGVALGLLWPRRECNSSVQCLMLWSYCSQEYRCEEGGSSPLCSRGSCASELTSPTPDRPGASP
ncbi:MAG: hypothetical protein KDK70_04385, partial [Myxococcales bacterium]|nr:hypothetical protein [Myxococcales bacterium]